MNGKMIVINTDGSMIVEDLKSVPPLKVLQENVGRYLEPVSHFNKFFSPVGTYNCVAFCNENGKINEEPANMVATLFWKKSFEEETKSHFSVLDNFLYGNVVILYGDDEFMKDI